MPASSDKSKRFARIPPALALASGLFVSRSKAHARTAGSNRCLATHESREGTYSFHGAGPLGADDLRVLQAIFLLASQPGPTIALAVQAPGGAVGLQLAYGLNSRGEAIGAGQAKIITTAIAALAEGAGYTATGGGSRTVVANALERLSQIEVRFKNLLGKENITQLLAKTSLNPAQDGIGLATDTLAIAIAPMFSEVLISNQPGRFVRIGADEIQSLGHLKADGARASILHMRLCGYIDLGKNRSVCVEKLAGYLFGETTDANTRRRQHSDVRRTIASLEGIGWRFESDTSRSGNRLFNITRPRLVRCPEMGAGADN